MIFSNSSAVLLFKLPDFQYFVLDTICHVNKILLFHDQKKDSKYGKNLNIHLSFQALLKPPF